MKIPHSKMPNNVVEHFGNSGGATVPTAITFNLAPQLTRPSTPDTRPCLACLAGFGGGLAWAAMLLRLGNLAFCEVIDYP